MGAPIYFAGDTETGGLLPEKQDLLTFYGGMYTEDWTLLEELELKLKPNDGRLPNVEAGALKVNGIDIHKHMADPKTVTYKEGNALLTAMLRRHLSKNGRYSNLNPMFYNAPFDVGFLQKYVLPADEWGSILHYKNLDPSQAVDFLKRCGWLPKEVGTLVSMVEFFGIPKRNAHTAKDDSLMMIDVWKKLCEMMKSKQENGSGNQDLISLLEQE